MIKTASKMSKAAREAKNKYSKEWRKNNPEKVKAALARYWEKKARGEREQQQDRNPNSFTTDKSDS